MKTAATLATLAAALLAAGAAAAEPRMSTYGRYEAPLGFPSFCAEHPGQCAARAARGSVRTAADGAVRLDAARRGELDAVNARVNASVVQVTDIALYGREEVWALPTGGAGDCEDIALAKRKELMALGWPSAALLITVVRDRAGDGHAVLTVRTSEGDLVLDNRTDAIRPWLATGYTFYIRQSEADPKRWVLITHGVPMQTASTAH